MIRHLTILTTCLLVIAGCGLSGDKSEEGYTFDQLSDGVKADPAHYEVTHECFENDNTVGDRTNYRTRIKLTNTDDRQRAFEVWVGQERFNFEDPRRVPREWQQPGETIEFEVPIGWKDDFPDGCPSYTVDVYQNPAEALVEGNQ